MCVEMRLGFSQILKELSNYEAHKYLLISRAIVTAYFVLSFITYKHKSDYIYIYLYEETQIIRLKPPVCFARWKKSRDNLVTHMEEGIDRTCIMGTVQRYISIYYVNNALSLNCSNCR